MVNRPPTSLAEVFGEYVRLRLNGWSVESVVRSLQPNVDRLNVQDREQLNQMVVAWEANLAKSAPAPEPPKKSVIRRISPMAVSSVTVEEEDTAGPSVPGTPGRKSVIRPISPRQRPAEQAEPTPNVAPEGRVFCPKCGKVNLNTTDRCYSCGQRLQRVGATDTQEIPAIRMDRSRLVAETDELRKIILLIRGIPRPVKLRDQGDTTIGRSSSDSTIRPDIDLAQFEADGYGVSRVHAAFRRDGELIQVVDLGSLNFTYINGLRLYPREVRVLRSGDEIRLGQLSIRVSFQPGQEEN